MRYVAPDYGSTSLPYHPKIILISGGWDWQDRAIEGATAGGYARRSWLAIKPFSDWSFMLQNEETYPGKIMPGD
jgi:hypothetical protein